MLPNPTDLGTFESDTAIRLRKINEKIAKAEAKRDRGFVSLVALHMVVIFTAASFLAFGLPEQQRLDRINQEMAYHD